MSFAYNRSIAFGICLLGRLWLYFLLNAFFFSACWGKCKPSRWSSKRNYTKSWYGCTSAWADQCIEGVYSGSYKVTWQLQVVQNSGSYKRKYHFASQKLRSGISWDPTVFSSVINFECSFIRTVCYLPYCYGISQNWWDYRQISESVVIKNFLKHVMILYAFQYTFQNKTLQYRKKKKNGKKSRSLHFERCVFLGLGVIFVMLVFSQQLSWLPIPKQLFQQSVIQSLPHSWQTLPNQLQLL